MTKQTIYSPDHDLPLVASYFLHIGHEAVAVPPSPALTTIYTTLNDSAAEFPRAMSHTR